ncbi:MAG TPA: hypothetical protein VEB66_06975 [Opitutaceae bacterium]|nr:hypothetical protein [Opitutaceae bacterium]
MKHPLRVDRQRGVGAALALSVDQLRVDLRPFLCPAGIPVQDQVAAAGPAIAVKEEKVAVRSTEELRVRHALLAPAGHREARPELQRAGRDAAGVVQRAVVVAVRDVEVAVAVERDRDGAVRVVHVRAHRGAGGRPRAAGKRAPREHEGAVRRVEGGVLERVVGDEGILEARDDVDRAAGEGVVGDELQVDARRGADRGPVRGEGNGQKTGEEDRRRTQAGSEGSPRG